MAMIMATKMVIKMELPEVETKDLFDIAESDIKSRHKNDKYTILELNDGTFWAYTAEDSYATRVRLLSEEDKSFSIYW